MAFRIPFHDHPQQVLPLLRRNLVASALLLILLFAISQIDLGYGWTWNVYVRRNVQDVKAYGRISEDARLTKKLGEDYQFLLYLRDATPTTAVIYYPSAEDFITKMPGRKASPFSGKLNDKLTAIRVLYPRRVVVKDEYQETPWSFRITHVAIVNGRNLDKLPYSPPKNYAMGVLPMDSTLIVTY